jgi:hypothetical protein
VVVKATQIVNDFRGLKLVLCCGRHPTWDGNHHCVFSYGVCYLIHVMQHIYISNIIGLRFSLLSYDLQAVLIFVIFTVT